MYLGKREALWPTMRKWAPRPLGRSCPRRRPWPESCWPPHPGHFQATTRRLPDPAALSTTAVVVHSVLVEDAQFVGDDRVGAHQSVGWSEVGGQGTLAHVG